MGGKAEGSKAPLGQRCAGGCRAHLQHDLGGSVWAAILERHGLQNGAKAVVQLQADQRLGRVYGACTTHHKVVRIQVRLSV